MNRFFKILKDNKGVTLFEILIVLAIIAVIGAVLLPNFFGVTDRARLRSDLQSTAVLNNAIALYRLSNSNVSANFSDIFESLVAQGYLPASASSQPQLNDAQWIYQDGRVFLDISGTSGRLDNLLGGLTATELSMLTP